MGRVIGIDLGTTNSCVAVLEGGEPVVIHNQEGGRTTPSMVSWNADGDVVVGAASKRQMVTNPQRTVFGAKRLIGRKATDPEVQNARAPAAVQDRRRARTATRGSISPGTPRSPQEISAHVLAKMKRVAEDYLGQPVDRGGRHRAGVLRRRAAPGDQGRRHDRRAHGSRRSSTSRPRPRSRTALHHQTQPAARGVRSRRRHVRYLDPRDRERRVRGARRPTATPRSAATTSIA